MQSFGCKRKPDSSTLLGMKASWPFTENLYNLPMPESKPLVAVIMGSKSDWDTMRNAVETLDELGVPNEARVLSAHRTPDATAEFARGAADRGLRVIIAGAGGAAHLAGVIAAHTWLPGLCVPIQSKLRSEEHTSELQSQSNLVCRLLLEKKKTSRA